jgi:hypothetical protein
LKEKIRKNAKKNAKSSAKTPYFALLFDSFESIILKEKPCRTAPNLQLGAVFFI